MTNHTIAELDTAAFDTTLQQNEATVLVDFWAPWCGPCRVQLPVLERVAANAGEDYSVFKVNVDDNEQLAVRYRISSIPTLLIFRDGELVTRLTGLQSEDALRKALAAARLTPAGVA
jgi:thioredoxin 1